MAGDGGTSTWGRSERLVRSASWRAARLRLGNAPGPASWLAAATELALPLTCAGCGRSGAGWCACCSAETRARLYPGGARATWPTPTPPGFPPTWAAGPYDAALRHVLGAYKDGGRRDVADVLTALLVAPLEAAVGRLSTPSSGSPRRVDLDRWGPPGAAEPPLVWIVPVPSSRSAVRSRGDAPLLPVALGAAGHLAVARPGLVWAPQALRHRRRVADQSGLSRAERAANLCGVLRADPIVQGACVVVVDDIVTTGATLAEAARALRAAGAAEVAGACVAATRRYAVRLASEGEASDSGG